MALHLASLLMLIPAGLAMRIEARASSTAVLPTASPSSAAPAATGPSTATSSTSNSSTADISGPAIPTPSLAANANTTLILNATDTFDYSAAVSSIAAYLKSSDFVAYVEPNQKVEEWIALGDSYTAGAGSNGLDEIVGGGDALRGQRAYPMVMSKDADGWSFINNEDTLPRFSFSAYTGDTTAELVSLQLQQGDFNPSNPNLPRHPFGKPQLAVLTIGGNDAGFGTIINNCIYRGWFPGDCQDTLNALQQSLDNGQFQDKINYALYEVAHAGRIAGGAVPPQSFQVYVTSYTTFFNDQDPGCDSISWQYWGYSTPLLDTNLRSQLNKLTTGVNTAIQNAANELKGMGVIYVDGLETTYNGHRYCEPGHTYKEMLDYETWYWSMYAPVQTAWEGPGDPNNPQPQNFQNSSTPNADDVFLNYVFPKGVPANLSNSSAPWELSPLAGQYPTLDSLLEAMITDGNASIAAAPFGTTRSFHPKGTAYQHHASMFMAAIADNRIGAKALNGTNSTSIPPPPTSVPPPTSIPPTARSTLPPATTSSHVACPTGSPTQCSSCPGGYDSKSCIGSAPLVQCFCNSPCGSVKCNIVQHQIPSPVCGRDEDVACQ